MSDIDYVEKAKFNNVLSEAELEIVTLLRGNDTITKLLHYPQDDALDNESCIVNSSIRNKVYRRKINNQTNDECRVFLSGFDPQVVKDARAEIHITFDNVKPYQRSTTKIPYLLIDIIVADSINTLSDGISQRHTRLFQEVCDTIEGHSVGTVGHIELAYPAKDTVLQNNTHVIWSAIYQVGEIKR